MKITIKVAREGDDTEGSVHCQTFLHTSDAHLTKMLKTACTWLMVEAHEKRLAEASDMRVEPSPTHWTTSLPPLKAPNNHLTLTEVDKKFLKDIGVGGLE
jgi:hypothetical protein